MISMRAAMGAAEMPPPASVGRAVRRAGGGVATLLSRAVAPSTEPIASERPPEWSSFFVF